MKYLVILIFVLISNIPLCSQEYLLIQEHGKLAIINYNSKSERDCYQCWTFKERIDLANIEDKELVGYNWESDSLVVFLSLNGQISMFKFEMDSIKNKIYARIKFKVSNMNAYYRPKNNPFVIYRYENIKLVSRSGGELKCYIDSTLLWSKKCKVKTFSCVTVGGGCWNPVLSQDKENILMIINGKLTEVDIKTGKEMNISKKRNSNYYYSQNGKYIIYKAEEHIDIYDKFHEKENIYTSWKNAFWVYK